MSEMYVQYYLDQAEGRGIGGNFKGLKGQKGNGLGSFLSGLFRSVFPYIKSGTKTIGNELFNTGVNLLRDNLNGKNFKESLKTRVTEAGNSLTSKAAKKLESMVGSGLKTRKRRRKTQSTIGRKAKRSKKQSSKRGKTKRRKTKRCRKDIFG
jgi:hypothetical protein